MELEEYVATRGRALEDAQRAHPDLLGPLADGPAPYARSSVVLGRG